MPDFLSCLYTECVSFFLIVFVDEGALVKGAKELGFFFKTRTPDKVTIEVVSYRVERRLLSGYLILYVHVLKFSSVLFEL